MKHSHQNTGLPKVERTFLRKGLFLFVFGISLVLASSLHATSSNGVVSWGFHGDPEDGDATIVVPVAALSDVIAISAGGYHSLALRSDGSVIAWGANFYNQAIVPLAAMSGVTAISAGFGHNLALKEDGGVVAWGDNGSGQTNVPPAALSGVVAIAAGSSASFALKDDGSVIAWGAPNLTNLPVGALSGVAALAAGANHGLALKTDGTVVAWGTFTEGAATVPDDLADVTAISAGFNFSLALKDDGTLVAWGRNVEGQANVPISAQSDVEAISVGDTHCLALKSDGSVVGWGSNNYGERVVPAGAQSEVLAISAGSLHNMVIKRIAVRPEIRITSPKKSGNYPSSGRIIIKGRATDNASLRSWEYKLNRDKWKTGGSLSGTSASWKKRVGKVKAGKNTVQVRAYDSAGLVSGTTKRVVNLKRR